MRNPPRRLLENPAGSARRLSTRGDNPVSRCRRTPSVRPPPPHAQPPPTHHPRPSASRRQRALPTRVITIRSFGVSQPRVRPISPSPHSCQRFFSYTGAMRIPHAFTVNIYIVLRYVVLCSDSPRQLPPQLSCGATDTNRPYGGAAGVATSAAPAACGVCAAGTAVRSGTLLCQYGVSAAANDQRAPASKHRSAAQRRAPL